MYLCVNIHIILYIYVCIYVCIQKKDKRLTQMTVKDSSKRKLTCLRAKCPRYTSSRWLGGTHVEWIPSRKIFCLCRKSCKEPSNLRTVTWSLNRLRHGGTHPYTYIVLNLSFNQEEASRSFQSFVFNVTEFKVPFRRYKWHKFINVPFSIVSAKISA